MDHSPTSGRSEAALLREVAYQKASASKLSVSATSDAVIARYRALRHWRFFPKEFMYRALGDVRERTILDFACGTGEASTQLAALGARVVGIDISNDLITLAKQRAALDNVAERTDFRACDIVKEPPLPNCFDAIFCSAALHHVDLRAVVPVLHACLKPGGCIVISEPISLSPVLQRLRDRLPLLKDASPDERQLNQADLDFLTNVFASCNFTYFALLSRLRRFIPYGTSIEGHPFAIAAVVCLARLDRALAAISPLQRFFGSVVAVGGKR
jgi:2-polyprenyl-3-methyl-5-hydroxy-6-metoxy-1,4-benzoquinol methylase